MSDVNLILAYVGDAPKTAALYARILGLQPVESSPTFAMFVLPKGARLGFWAKHEVEPSATPPGGIELCFAVADEAAVGRTLKEWQALGLAVIQPPTTMDFGYTATLTDPDGHRLRVYAPSPQ